MPHVGYSRDYNARSPSRFRQAPFVIADCAIAARLAVELGHPVDDCLYLALAASHSALLATADDRLTRAAERLGVGVWSHGGSAGR
ncbi:MAG: type II toxin-antitoxin system VapC family toxin [Candidatus Rokuibacteriota bacterium]